MKDVEVDNARAAPSPPRCSPSRRSSAREGGERAEGRKEKNAHLIREPAPTADALRLAVVDDPMSDDCVILQGRQYLGE